MKKVISLALFGDRAVGRWYKTYTQFLGAVLRAHHVILPVSEGWSMRIHHDSDALGRPYGRTLKVLEKRGLVTLRDMGKAEDGVARAMLWRLEPVYDPEVDAVFCRDVDALPMPRDRGACEAFLASKATIHAIHDRRVHDRVLGGLCGFKAEAFRKAITFKSVDEICRAWGLSRWKHGADQDVINNLLRPKLSLFEHRYPTQSPDTRATYSELARHSVSPLADDLQVRADRLAPYLGSAGFDWECAVEFYEDFGGDAAKAIADAEAEAGEKPDGSPL